MPKGWLQRRVVVKIAVIETSLVMPICLSTVMELTVVHHRYI
jgi:hypothetical protein